MLAKESATFFFFLEILDHENQRTNPSNIFRNANNESPSWFIYFTMSNCPTCNEYAPEVAKLA